MQPSHPVEPSSSPSADRGIVALCVFVAAALLVVVAVVVANAVDRWWVLVPVMLIDFAAAFWVMLTVNRLIDHDG